MPFKNSRSISSLSKNASIEQIISYLIETDITVDIGIGINPQIVPMSLSLTNKYIYTTSNTLDIGVFDKDKSLSFKTNN